MRKTPYVVALNQIDRTYNWQSFPWSGFEDSYRKQKDQQKKNKQVMFTIIGIAVLVIGLVGVTYAFFNYTRTGSANTIKTGEIYFNAEQGNTVTLSDLFPITVAQNETVTASTPGVGSLTLHLTGNTTYEEGVEYLIEAVDVTSSGQSALPISIQIAYAPTEPEQGQPANSIGTADDAYFTNRGGATSVYKLLSTGSITEGEDILVGYIAPDTTIDGELTILAYLDASNIAITDTYPEGTVHTVKTTGYSSSDCETALTGVTNASTYCASASSLQTAIDNENLTSAQITLLVNAGIVEEYTDGTTSTWVNNRTVFTTEQWNALQATGVSFKIKATANEGTWVTAPANPGAATLSLSPASGTIDMSTATTTTSTITTNGNGALSCASSDDTVATCSVTGTTLTITGVANGTATITVTEAAGTLYSTPATATYDVTVTNTP